MPTVAASTGLWIFCIVDFQFNLINKFHSFLLIDSNHVCAAGTDGQDTCQNDSGGPMFLSENGRYNTHIKFLYITTMLPTNITIFCRNTLIGLTSFGTGCGDPSYPGVYSRVTEVLAWIQATVTGSQTSDCE